MKPAAFTRITSSALAVAVMLGATWAVTAAGRAAAPQSAADLTVCRAGSLQAALSQVEQRFVAQHPGVMVKAVSGGSVALAGRLAAGLEPCDVYAAADYQVIDLLLKPMNLADYTIVFAKGRMVLAYLATDPMTHGIAGGGELGFPRSIAKAADDWYRLLLQPGARVAGSHPFLDPAGYRAHMIFQLAQTFYGVPHLYDSLLEHYAILPNVGGPDERPRPTLGSGYNFQFIYEHSAAAASKSNPSYRYVTLPDRIDLSTASNNSYYAAATLTIPGIGPPGTVSQIAIPATPVAWGLTIPRTSPHPANAIAFVNLLLGTVGTAALTANGPEPITPAIVRPGDYTHLPGTTQPLVVARDRLP